MAELSWPQRVEEMKREQRLRGCTCATRKWGDPLCPLADPIVLLSLPPGCAKPTAKDH